MEAAEKSVQSPIVVPQDVQEMEFGGDAVIRTTNPAGVRRVELPIPSGAFTEQTLLQQELRTGTRYPESRTGNLDASIITGQGVQALMGGFDTQVKSAQAIFASALKDVISICFEVDETSAKKYKALMSQPDKIENWKDVEKLHKKAFELYTGDARLNELLKIHGRLMA